MCCIILASSEVSCKIIYHHSFDGFNPYLYFEFFFLLFFTQDELRAVTILIVQSMLWSRRDRPRANFPVLISQTNLKDAPHKHRKWESENLNLITPAHSLGFACCRHYALLHYKSHFHPIINTFSSNSHTCLISEWMDN